jgi:hypothetical protein
MAMAPVEHEQKQDEERTGRTVGEERERRSAREIDAAQPEGKVLPLVKRVAQRSGDGDALAGVQRQEREHQMRIGFRTDAAQPASHQAAGREQRAGDGQEPLDAMTLTRRARLREAVGQRRSPHTYLPRRPGAGVDPWHDGGPSGTFDVCSALLSSQCVDEQYLCTCSAHVHRTGYSSTAVPAQVPNRRAQFLGQAWTWV